MATTHNHHEHTHDHGHDHPHEHGHDHPYPHDHEQDHNHDGNPILHWFTHLFSPHSHGHQEAALDPALATDRGIWALKISFSGLMVTAVFQVFIVAISGSVASLAEKKRANRNCWIAGVRAVDDSDLQVDWTRRDQMRRTGDRNLKNNEVVKQAIQAAFARDPRIASFGIGVEVDSGTVTLRGKVANLKARKVAE